MQIWFSRRQHSVVQAHSDGGPRFQAPAPGPSASDQGCLASLHSLVTRALALATLTLPMAVQATAQAATVLDQPLEAAATKILRAVGCTAIWPPVLDSTMRDYVCTAGLPHEANAFVGQSTAGGTYVTFGWTGLGTDLRGRGEVERAVRGLADAMSGMPADAIARMFFAETPADGRVYRNVWTEAGYRYEISRSAADGGGTARVVFVTAADPVQ